MIAQDLLDIYCWCPGAILMSTVDQNTLGLPALSSIDIDGSADYFWGLGTVLNMDDSSDEFPGICLSKQLLAPAPSPGPGHHRLLRYPFNTTPIPKQGPNKAQLRPIWILLWNGGGIERRTSELPVLEMTTETYVRCHRFVKGSFSWGVKER